MLEHVDPELLDRPRWRIRQARVRAAMGDETADYQVAIDRHYAQGPPLDWSETYVSAYATMHPWEDFAESWAQVMHVPFEPQGADVREL